MPFPVAPVVGFIAHAAPTEASSTLVVTLSYNSVNEDGEVAAQPEKALSLLTIANIITAEFAEVVVSVVAVAVVPSAVAIFRVEGSISKGPPAVPSAFTPPETSTPLNATIEPIAISALELGSEKENELPSVPSATL